MEVYDSIMIFTLGELGKDREVGLTVLKMDPRRPEEDDVAAATKPRHL